MWRKIQAVWASVMSFTATHRALVIALLSSFASAAFGVAMISTKFGMPHILAALTIFLIVIAGTVSSRYEAAPLLTLMLPTIHKVLDLKDNDRITIHHLKSERKRTYEQLTDYFPRVAVPARGRRFYFTHGIVAQCFMTLRPHCWSVPPGKDFDEAMNERWSFDKEELARLTRDRRSFMAYPIGQEGIYAQAVLYLDSDDPQRFTEARCVQYVDVIERYFIEQIREALRKL